MQNIDVSLYNTRGVLEATGSWPMDDPTAVPIRPDGLVLVDKGVGGRAQSLWHAISGLPLLLMRAGLGTTFGVRTIVGSARARRHRSGAPQLRMTAKRFAGETNEPKEAKHGEQDRPVD